MTGYRRTRVLFVCLGNSCRSPMAEGIAAQNASDVMEVSSAGVAALGCVQSLTKLTLAKNGYPADGLQSKALKPAELDAADVVINMTGLPGVGLFQDRKKVEDWSVEDPYGGSAEVYQRVFEDVERRVGDLAKRLRIARSSGAVGRDIEETRPAERE